MAALPADDRPRDIAVSRLLLDQSNARLGELQSDQKATTLALAERLGTQLFEMANDILKNGTDPSASLIVTPEGAPSGKFRVLEGNRRTLAVKALTNPEIVRDALTPNRYQRLKKLSEEFHKNPISRLRCVVFTAEKDADHWIQLRHTGANSGVGLVEWDSNDQDRWMSRRGGPANRNEAGQILDFVEKFHPIKPGDSTRIISTLDRIVGVASSRNKLGLTVKSGEVYSFFPVEEVLKGLAKIVFDLRSTRIKVGAVYDAARRDAYLASLTEDELPNPDTRLSEPVPLTDLANKHSGNQNPSESTDKPGGPESSAPGSSTSGESATGPEGAQKTNTSPSTRKSRVKPPKLRTTTIPNSCSLFISHGRINAIYHELMRLDLEMFVNSCAVTLRVFIELSVDHHVALESVIPESTRGSMPLAKRMKELAKHLRFTNRIDEQLEKAINRVADGRGVISASTTTFNQYVHNSFTYPQPSDLRAAWDELEPFMKTLWVK